MRDETGQKIDLLEKIRSATVDVPVDIPVRVSLKNENGAVPLRVCALRRPPGAVDAAMERIRLKCSKKQTGVSDECREANEYITLFTSLPDSISTESVLRVYRYRRQIEIYFKRLKSLMAFGEET